MRTIRLPRLHAAQLEVVQTSKRFNTLCCGRRWGKSTLGEDRLVHPALAGKPVAWYAPSYKLLAPVWRDLQRVLQPVTAHTNQQERRLELETGGVIEMWSLDSPDSGRGRSYARIVVDEAALVADLERAWNESLRAQLADYRGDAWFLSTPKGIANYFHTMFQRGADSMQTDWASWQMPTSTNRHIASSEIDAAQRDLTDLAFSQEYLAQFVSWEGAVFRRILDAVDRREVPKVPAVAIGVDWARTTDYTVFVAISTTGHVLELERFRGIEYSIQRDRLRAMWERHGRDSYIFAETNNMGGPLVEQIRRDGLPVVAFTTTNVSKAAVIESLALGFERGSIKIPNDPVLIGELQAFEGRRLPSGLTRYSAPDGVHDDCVIALALAWQGLANWESQRAPGVHVAPAEWVEISPI